MLSSSNRNSKLLTPFFSIVVAFGISAHLGFLSMFAIIARSKLCNSFLLFIELNKVVKFSLSITWYSLSSDCSPSKGQIKSPHEILEPTTRCYEISEAVIIGHLFSPNLNQF